MGIVERREREKELVRGKILQAARELFATEGYERVTMRRVAEAIEYSPTTIYLHFKDKNELVHELCQQNFTRLMQALAERGVPEDPIAGLRQLGLGYARFGLEHPNHYRFMFLTPFGPDHRPSEAGQAAFQMLRDAVARAADAGRFRSRDVETMAQVLWSSLHGAIALLITYGADKFPGAPAVDDLIEQVAETSLRGLLAAPETPKTKAPTKTRTKARRR